jgi:hypothetical protein
VTVSAVVRAAVAGEDRADLAGEHPGLPARMRPDLGTQRTRLFHRLGESEPLVFERYPLGAGRP